MIFDRRAAYVPDSAGMVDVAALAANFRAELVGIGLHQHVLDETAHGASAIQRPMRTAQHFETLDVVGQR